MLDAEHPIAGHVDAWQPAAAPRLGDDLPLTREVPESVNWLRGLRCVAAVAAHGSSTRAAQAIHLSQPATTRAVLDLEQRLGHSLFERGARGMTATPFGARVALRARRLHHCLTQGAADAVELAAPDPGQCPADRRMPRPERFAAVVAPASIRALVALSSEGSESRAAAALGLSQPAVHRALRVLEDACGATLYRRAAPGIRLTDSGHALLRRVKLALAELHALDSDLAAMKGACRGRIIVGTLPLSVHQVLPQAITALRARQPGIEVTVVDGTYESLIRALQCADIDLIVGALRPLPSSELVQETLFHDELAVVARAGHPCLLDPPSLPALQRWPWVLPLPATPARAALERAFAEAGLSPPSAPLQSNSAHFMQNLVAHSDHLALTSRRQVQAEVAAGMLCSVPVALGETHRAIGMAMRGDAQAAPELQSLIAALREVAACSGL